MKKEPSAAKPFAVELDPPSAPDLAKFLSGAQELWAHGASAITLADCPFASPRMDPILLACLLQEKYGIAALPHLTCRDRNLNAIQAALTGLSAQNVGQVLLVTGDPIPADRRRAVKSVFNFNSRELIRFASSLNEMLLAQKPLRLFAALNVNALNFQHELIRAREKELAGAYGFFTQPVLTDAALLNLREARKVLNGQIYGGIMPIVSEKNALHLSREVSGIRVDPAIAAAYAGADRARGEELAVEISTRFAGEMEASVDGFYLITPFGRTALICRIMDSIRALGENEASAGSSL